MAGRFRVTAKILSASILILTFFGCAPSVGKVRASARAASSAEVEAVTVSNGPLLEALDGWAKKGTDLSLDEDTLGSFTTDTPYFGRYYFTVEALLDGYLASRYRAGGPDELKVEYLDRVIRLVDGVLKRQSKTWYIPGSPSRCASENAYGIARSSSGCWDELRNKKMSGWGTTKYKRGDAFHFWALHNALVSSPITKFIKIVAGDPTLRESRYSSPGSGGESRFLVAARHFLTEVHQIVTDQSPIDWNVVSDVFNRSFPLYPRGVIDDRTGISLTGVELPLNMGAALGVALADLSQIDPLALGVNIPDRRSYFLNGAVRLTRHLVRKMTAEAAPENGYQWLYNPDPELRRRGINSRYEDIGHGNMEIALLMRAKEYRLADGNGVLVSNTLTVRLQRTWTRNIYKTTNGKPDPFWSVNGTGAHINARSACRNWLELLRGYPNQDSGHALYDQCHTLYHEPDFPKNVMSLALLARLEPIAACLKDPRHPNYPECILPGL